MNHTLGERLNIHFNSKIRIEFHGARLTSDGGLLAYRELDAASRQCPQCGSLDGWTSIPNSRICERKLQRLKKIVIFLFQQADKMLYYIKKVIKRDFKSK